MELTVTPLDPRSFTPLRSEDFDRTGTASRRRAPKKVVVVAAVGLAVVVVVVAIATTRVTRPIDRYATTLASPKTFDVAARHLEQPTSPGPPPHLRDLQHLRDIFREKRVVSGINVPLRATAIEQGWAVSCWVEQRAWSRPPHGAPGRTPPRADACHGRRPG